jgi:hemerythrin-like domain-containing protein
MATRASSRKSPSRKSAKPAAKRASGKSERPMARGVASSERGVLAVNRPSSRAKSAPRKTAGEARQPRAQDAIALLRADHKAVTEMFDKFEKMKGDTPQKKALVERICNELEVHTKIEEEIFYPTVRPVLKDDDMMDEATVEHAGAKDLIAQLRGMNPGEELYDAKVTVLSEYIKHHVKEEQNEMFPKVKKTKLDLKELGERLKQRKGELMTNIAD